MFDMKETQWIPVTERMPEMHEEQFVDIDGSIYPYCESDLVLAYTDDGEYVVAKYLDDPDTHTEWVYEDYSKALVTHWMHLPKPPKEVSHGRDDHLW